MSDDINLLIEQAIAELTLPRDPDLGAPMTPASERTVAITLQAIDGQLGPRGGTMLFQIGTGIVRAVTLLEMIRDRLAERGV